MSLIDVEKLKTLYRKAYGKGMKAAYNEVIWKLKQLKDMPGCVGNTVYKRSIDIEWLIKWIDGKMKEDIDGEIDDK